MKGFLKRRISDDLINKIQMSKIDNKEYLINHLQKGIPAISLTSNNSLITAISNDTSSEMIFAQQIFGIGNKNDVLIAISTSGNSKNVVNAAKISKILGIQVISLTGESGGELKYYSDILLNVSEKITFKIQELHLPLNHLLFISLEYELFGE